VENVRNIDNLDLSLVIEYSEDNMVDKKHKLKENPDSPTRSPEIKKGHKKKKKTRAIDDFCEVDLKK